MVGFLSLCSSSHYYHLQLRNGSVQYELIRPIKYRPRSITRCCSTTRGKAREDYYQVLGVTVNSTPQEIKEAYRKLQKRNHPDIAGYKAYKVLMRNSSRNADASGRGFWERFHWKQVKLLEWACEKPCTLCGREQIHSRIGCRECVHHAGETSRWTMFLEALTSKSSLETWSTRYRYHILFEFLTKHTLSLELRHYY